MDLEALTPVLSPRSIPLAMELRAALLSALGGILAFSASARAQDPGPLPPLPLAGFEGDLQALTGEWVGTYEGDENGRSGTLIFRFEAGADTAHGYVVMLPQTASGETPRPVTLAARLIWVADGQVEGLIEPYGDPVSGVELETWFHGRVVGDRVEGEFEAREVGGSGPRQTGRWRAQRSGAI